jgi:hypothetical protein
VISNPFDVKRPVPHESTWAELGDEILYDLRADTFWYCEPDGTFIEAKSKESGTGLNG